MKVKNMKLFLILFLSMVFALSLDSCKKAEELPGFNAVIGEGANNVALFKSYIEKCGGFEAAQIVDIRSEELYIKGHISGAKNISARTESADKDNIFEDKSAFDIFNKNKPIFIYGESGLNYDYLAPAYIATIFGKNNTCVLTGGGFEKWKEASTNDPSYKITKGKNP